MMADRESPPEETSAGVAAASAAVDNNNSINTDQTLSDKLSHSVATLSSPWEFDDLSLECHSCRNAFNALNRRHHCRLCGKIFCNDCTKQRALIPPSSIVLIPIGGKKAKPRNENEHISFSPDDDPDRMLTYVSSSPGFAAGGGGHNGNHQNNQLLYGKGLEERFKLAREPLRVCGKCCDKLRPLQEELRCSNSNAMRFNHIDPTDMRRLFNSPIAFTLGHEVRKAAYTLNNLLPLPNRMGAVLPSSLYDGHGSSPSISTNIQHCKENCATVSPNMSSLDGVRIPARLLEHAKGVAVLTVAKGGFGLAGVEFGTGLVVARLGDQWSAPSAIGTGGLSWGALIGAQVSDHVFLLMTDAAVEMMFACDGSIQLGADIGVAVGPLGRAFEADFGASIGKVAPIYTYSLSKGFYAGISLDGKVIVTRNRVNEKFYGREVSGLEILQGMVPTPPAAQPLYEALTRVHVYASGTQRFSVIPKSAEMEYGELPDPIPVMAPATNDQHSYSGISDITFNRSHGLM